MGELILGDAGERLFSGEKRGMRASTFFSFLSFFFFFCADFNAVGGGMEFWLSEEEGALRSNF